MKRGRYEGGKTFIKCSYPSYKSRLNPDWAWRQIFPFLTVLKAANSARTSGLSVPTKHSNIIFEKLSLTESCFLWGHIHLPNLGS